MVTDSQLDEYFNYADYRSIIIRVADDFYEVEKNPEAVYFVSLPGDVVDDQDEIRRILLKYLFGRDGFSIEQKNSNVECGASGAAQEILVNIVGGLGTAFLLYVGNQIKIWLKNQPSYEDTPFNDVEALENIKSALITYFKAVEPLTASEQSSSLERFEVNFCDAHHKHFQCSIDRETGLFSIKRA